MSLSLNNNKSRMNHETGPLVKHFWMDAAKCHDDFEDNNDGQLQIVNNNNNTDFQWFLEEEKIMIDLTDATMSLLRHSGK